MKRIRKCARCGRRLLPNGGGVAAHQRRHDRDDLRQLAILHILIRANDRTLFNVNLADLRALNQIAGKQLTWNRACRVLEVEL